MVRENSADFKIHTIMTDKDKKLIEQAKRLHSTQWDVAYLLAEQADTETAREFIKSIGSLLSRKCEARAGLL